MTDDLPFPRGETYFNGGTADTTSGKHLEGQIYEVRDDIRNTGATIKLMVVRNNSGIALLPKRLAQLDFAGANPWQAKGYARSPDDPQAFPIDELLPSAGVPDKDLFYVVVEGPALCLTSLANYAADLSSGSRVIALTAATSQATSAGRVAVAALVAETTSTASTSNNQVLWNYFGRAISSALTSATNSDILVNVGRRF